ncbi:MAG TPA: hypothetical protein DCW90_10215 [Lachnospiraceae bacterium]|nr:hypothetical protein [Lachnospiraceae bacterium]
MTGAIDVIGNGAKIVKIHSGTQLESMD